MDVSPDGQYAQFQNTIGGQAPDLALSVLNTGNILPKSFPNHDAHWQNPKIKVNGADYLQYLEEDGTPSIIPLSRNGSGWTPSVSAAIFVYFKLIGTDTLHYTYPQHLANLQDFVDNWKENWAKSLVQYHPEYCYYESCAKYSVVQTGDTRTSDDFDELLLQTKTYDKAVAANLILSSYPTTPNVPADTDIKKMAVFVYSTSANIVKDPFLTSYGTYGQSLPNIVTNFQKIGLGNYSMVEVAAMTARCGTNYGTNPISAPCTSFGKIVGTDPNKALDQEWNLLKNFYLSEKRKIQQQLADDYTKTSSCQGYVGCIGDSTYNPYTSGMYNVSSGTVNWASSLFLILPNLARDIIIATIWVRKDGLLVPMI